MGRLCLIVLPGRRCPTWKAITIFGRIVIIYLLISHGVAPSPIRIVPTGHQAAGSRHQPTTTSTHAGWALNMPRAPLPILASGQKSTNPPAPGAWRRAVEGRINVGKHVDVRTAGPCAAAIIHIHSSQCQTPRRKSQASASSRWPRPWCMMVGGFRTLRSERSGSATITWPCTIF